MYQSAVMLCVLADPACADLLLLACAEGMPRLELARLSKGPLLLEVLGCLGSVT